MTDQHPEALPFRTRTVYLTESEVNGTEIRIDHVYAPDGVLPCEECGGPARDPGLVGIFMTGTDGQDVAALLGPGEAALLALRIQRAVNLIMESDEDLPDIEREAARFAMAAEPEADPVRAAVWQAWEALSFSREPSPVKRVAASLSMSTADVAAIIFPPDRFGTWDDSQEPDLPA
jgi:hypothetical protein